MSNELATQERGGLATTSGMPGPSASTPTTELIEMAKLVAAAHLIPGVDTAPAAFTLMLICQAQGLHPGEALTRFHIIHNRPVMRADAMQAEFQRRGGIIRWQQWDREVCRAVYLHPVHAPEPGIEITTTLAEMMQSGEAMQWDKEAPNGKGGKGALVLKDNYRSMPHKMLRARNISEGVRMVLPGVVVGIYTPEEAADLPLAPQGGRGQGQGQPRTVEARVNETEAVGHAGGQQGQPGNGNKAKNGGGGIVPPAIADQTFRDKVTASSGLPGIVRPDGNGAGSGPVDYTESTEPIHDDQKQRLRYLVQDVLRLSPDEWQAMLLPYHATRLGDLTAMDAAAIIRSLEVRAEGDPFGPAGIVPGTPKDDDPRIPLINEVLSIVGKLGWDTTTLEIIALSYFGTKDVVEMNEENLALFISALKAGEIKLDDFGEIPDATRPFPKRPARKTKSKEDPKTDHQTAATGPTPAAAQ